MQTKSAAPEGYNSVQPYLIVKGAAAAISFYKQAFGASERLCMKNPEGTIGHAEIVIGNACVMLADEHPAISAYAPEHYGGSPVSLMMYVDNCDDVYSRALAAGAQSLREPADMPYGDRMAGVKDPFGYSWHLGTRIQAMSREELEAL